MPRFKTSIPGISHESRINCVSPTLPLYSTISWNGFSRLQPVLLGFSAFCFGVVCVQSSPQKNTADIDRLHFWPEHQTSSRLVLACYTGSNLQIDRTVRNLEIMWENAGIIIFVILGTPHSIWDPEVSLVPSGPSLSIGYASSLGIPSLATSHDQLLRNGGDGYLLPPQMLPQFLAKITTSELRNVGEMGFALERHSFFPFWSWSEFTISIRL